MQDGMERALRAGLQELGLELPGEAVERMCRFGRALLDKNQVMNLTAITDPVQVARLHFLDSLTLLTLADLSGKRVIDVGCGGGFPGVPLKLACPGLELTLLDSLGKRMAWLQETLPPMGIEALCVTARAEEYALQAREQYDYAVSRAVARLDILCELCLPFVRVGGAFLAMKGAGAAQELEQAARAIELLGGRLERTKAFPQDGVWHSVAVIRKTRPTPPQYPRRFSKIKQRPLQ